jgi:hypothetical protein
LNRATRFNRTSFAPVRAEKAVDPDRFLIAGMVYGRHELAPRGIVFVRNALLIPIKLIVL